MDLIKLTNINAVNVADELLKPEIQSSKRQNEFPVLEDWEMMLAGGGDGLVCW